MSGVAPGLLILGSGANVGAGVARAFATKGYKVASTLRKPREDGKEKTDLHIQSDLSDADSASSKKSLRHWAHRA